MASSYLSRTPASAGNRQTWTLSWWCKILNFNNSNNPKFLDVGTNYINFQYNSGKPSLYFEFADGLLDTAQTFRDSSAWYHIVITLDTTNATSADRLRLYVNGNRVTSFTTNTQPSLNANSTWNTNTLHEINHRIGQGNETCMDICYANYYFIDGQALTPSSFGETDATTGIWKPKSYSGSYGANGFFLKFENSASLGLDSSGNGNNFTVNGTPTQTVDTPSNNFATINGVEGITKTLTNGNLTLTASNKAPRATLGFSKGKWYWECKLVTQINSEQVVGIVNETFNPTDTIGSDAYGWGYIIQSNANNGQAYHSNATTQYGTLTTNDILNIAVDMDNQAIYFGKNGTWQNSGVPTSGASKTGAIYTNLPTSGFVFPSLTSTSTGVININFGNGYFGSTAITSPNSDGAGLGKFQYTVPTGYYSLCTKNINVYG